MNLYTAILPLPVAVPLLFAALSIIVGLSRGERVVGKAECAAFALERCRREQPPVEEGDVAEDPRRRRTFGTRCVERAEEQRTQQTVMQRTPAFQMGRRLPQQELRVVIEPPFGLQKCEKQAARRAQNGKLPAFRRRR